MSKFSHVLITGASSGIGEALALYYASAGVRRLSICGRNAERLEKVAEKCRQNGCEVETKILDVVDASAIAEWINLCNAQMPLNLVFANAGVASLDESSDNVRNTFNINVFGVVNTVLPILELFKKAPSEQVKHLVITASVAGYHGLPACPSYSATKACVKAWGEALRPRLKKIGVNVSVVCPGFVRSRITDYHTCPMAFFMEDDAAATLFSERVEKNVGLIAFPWPMRFDVWLGSILPNCISDFIYGRLPYKV